MVSIIENGGIVLGFFIVLFLCFKLIEFIQKRKHKNKLERTYKHIAENFSIGDTVKVITCPREYDNADAYAGYIGTIDAMYDNGKSLILKGETSYLVIPFTENLKLQKL